ncbi:TraR/DksA C4-type zinc finger protein [Ensifer canadensis]
MTIGDFERELSEQRVEQEKDAAIAAARAALTGPGLAHCEDCDRPISEARRQALPSATRCVVCQDLHEIDKRKATKWTRQ